MPYRLLIGFGAGLVSAVLFASATTGPLLMRMVLFLLTPLPLFLAGLGLGLARRRRGRPRRHGIRAHRRQPPCGALVFAAAQAVPVAVLAYLASLNRQDADGSVEWYPAGRLVVAAAIIAGIFSTLTLFLLGGDVETLRTALRDMLQTFVNTELPKMPDAPTLGPAEIDEATAIALALLPAALGHLDHGQPAVQLSGSPGASRWRPGGFARPWPDLLRIEYPPVTPLLLAVATGAAFLPGAAGARRRRLRRRAVPRLRAARARRHPLHHARARLAAVRAVGPLRLALHHEHRRLAGDRAARPGGSRLADAPELSAPNRPPPDRTAGKRNIIRQKRRRF